MAATPVTRPKPLLAAKWVIPFLPWLSVFAAALMHPGYWLSFDGRVLHVVGVTAYSAAFLAVIQPWRRDDARSV